MKFTIVEFADTAGGGFARQPDPGPPVDREYWASAQKLIQREVMQPPDTVKPTRGNPVWGLRRAAVGGQDMWCFWLQGRGGEFGPAGTVRFGFIDTTDHPALVWRAGVEQVARQAYRQTQPEKEDADAMFRVLGEVGLGSKRIAIPATPAQAARIIGGVLGVLPPAEIEGRVWATCLLQPLDDQSVVAAPLPESIAVAQYVRRIDRTLGITLSGMDYDASKLQELLKVRDQVDGVKRLVGHALKADLIYEHLKSRPRTFAELLDCVNSELGGLSVLQVGDLMATAEGRQRLRSSRQLVEEWAQTDREAALEKVRELAVQPIVDWVFAGLVTVQAKATVDVIGWPVHERADESWPDKLGELLKRRFPKPTELVEFIKDLLRRNVLSRSDLVRGRGVLSAAGLKPKSARDVFPLTVELIADSLRSATGLTTDMRDEIAGYRDDDPSGSRLKLLTDAVLVVADERRLKPMTPGDALGYFAAADLKNQPDTKENHDLAAQLADCLAKAALSPNGQPSTWLLQFLKGLNSVDGRKQGPRQLAALGALNVLDEWEFPQLRSSDRESLNKAVRALGVWQSLSPRQEALLQPQAPPAPRHAAPEPTTFVQRRPRSRDVEEIRRESPTRRGSAAPADQAGNTYVRRKWTANRLRRLAFTGAAVATAILLLCGTIMANSGRDNDSPTVISSFTSSASPSPSPARPREVGTISVNRPLKDVLSVVQTQVEKEKNLGDIRITGVMMAGNLPGEPPETLPNLLQQLLDRLALKPADGFLRPPDLDPAPPTGTVTVDIRYERLG